MAIKTSQLIVQLIDRVSAPARGVERALNGINAAVARNNARMDAIRGKLLDAAVAGISLATALAAPIRAAANFESLMLDIGQKADLSDSAVSDLGKRIRQLAPALGALPSEMAGGVDFLMGMGLDQGRAMEIIGPITRAAKAYKAEITDLSKAGYAALDNLKIPANEFGRALDVMAAAGKAGAFELKDMAQYLPALSAQAQNLGILGVKGMADLGAALQVVRKGAGDSAQAATNLRNVLQKIESPATRRNFKKLGIDISKQLAAGAKKGISPIEVLAEATSKAMKKGAKLSDLFEDAEVQQGLLALMANMGEYRRIRSEALAAQGVVEADFARRTKTAEFQMQRLRAGMENLAIIVGSALLPPLNALIDVITPLASRFADFAEAHPELIRNLTLAAAGLVSFRVAALAAQWAGLFMKGAVLQAAAAVLTLGRAMLITPATWALTTALTILSRPLAVLPGLFRAVGIALRFAFVSSGVGAIIAGIAAAGTFIYENWSGLGEFFTAFGQSFMAALGPLRGPAEAVAGAVSRMFDAIVGMLGPIDESGAKWRAWGEALGAAAAGGVAALISGIERIAGAIGWVIDKARAGYDALKNFFSLGSGAGPQAPGSLGTPSGTYRPEPGYTPLPGISGTRAMGGRVSAGHWYGINERGREVFAPGASGTVFPHAALAALARQGGAGAAAGGGAQRPVTIGPVSISVSGVADPRRIAEDLGREITRRLAGSHFDFA